jgi:predicted transcriptional regulator
MVIRFYVVSIVACIIFLRQLDVKKIVTLLPFDVKSVLAALNASETRVTRDSSS